MRSDGFFFFRALKKKERPVLWERRRDEFEDLKKKNTNTFLKLWYF